MADKKNPKRRSIDPMLQSVAGSVFRKPGARPPKPAAQPPQPPAVPTDGPPPPPTSDNNVPPVPPNGNPNDQYSFMGSEFNLDRPTVLGTEVNLNQTAVNGGPGMQSPPAPPTFMQPTNMQSDMAATTPSQSSVADLAPPPLPPGGVDPTLQFRQQQMNRRGETYASTDIAAGPPPLPETTIPEGTTVKDAPGLPGSMSQMLPNLPGQIRPEDGTEAPSVVYQSAEMTAPPMLNTPPEDLKPFMPSREELGEPSIEEIRAKKKEKKDKSKTKKKMPIGEILVQNGVINRNELEYALQYQQDQARDKKLGEILIRLNLIKDNQYDLLINALLQQMTSQELALDEVGQFVNLNLAEKLSLSRLERENFFPLRIVEKGGVRVLDVFIEDDTDLFKLDELAAIYGVGQVRSVGKFDPTLLKSLIQEIQRTKAAEIKPGEGVTEDMITMLKAPSDEDIDPDAIQRGREDNYISRMVDKIIYEGVKLGSSDIHVEYGEVPRVRYRVDGILQEGGWISTEDFAAMTSRFKIISGLDITERRVPQDGNIRLGIEGRGVLDFRVSTVPVAGGAGEKIVLRILDGSKLRELGIDAIGLTDEILDHYMGLLESPQGMILITGPTGSGKSTLLYSSLYYLLDKKGKEINICTAEDPIEYSVQGLNQVQLNEKQGLTFPKILKAFLRQDPDIILVGEIRDLETASLGIKAAQTGHLVLSTLHTNTTIQTIGRMANMGVPRYLIGETVLCIFNQRLARRLCQECKQPHYVEDKKTELMIPKELRAAAREGKVYFEADGCSSCNGSGYKGRLGLYEFLPITKVIKAGIIADKTEMEMLDIAAEQGVLTLREYGLKKAQEGVTSLEQVKHHTLDMFEDS